MDKKELQRRAGITEQLSAEEKRMYEIAAELADLMLGSPMPQNVLRQVENRAREYYSREVTTRHFGQTKKDG